MTNGADSLTTTIANFSQASTAANQTSTPVGDFATLDLARQARTGRPEVVYAAGKSPDQVVAIASVIVARQGIVLISRAENTHAAALKNTFTAPAYSVIQREQYPTILVQQHDYQQTTTGGHVGILTAGTSDLPVADEARCMAELLGCRVTLVADVGVAGLHRLFAPLQALHADNAAAIIVVAGMDGALPSVVAGLATVPTIGLPTSVGYGAGGAGIGALLAMLQTCVPGLTVVNIDNGIGAGAAAAMIANAVTGRVEE